MTSRGDEVKQSVNTVVSKPWITLNPGFFGEDVIVLSLKIPNNLRKAASISLSDTVIVPALARGGRTLLRYLFDHQSPGCPLWSMRFGCLPRPTRALSSVYVRCLISKTFPASDPPPTDCDWLDPHSLFQVCIRRVVRIFALQDLPTTQGIDESGPA